MTKEEKVKAWNLVEMLRAPEGHSVTLMCDNPDFNGQPNCAIEVISDWTAWAPRRFTADTVLDALQEAHELMDAYEVTKLQSDD